MAYGWLTWAAIATATIFQAPSIWDAASTGHTGVNVLLCRGGAGLEFRSLGYRQAPPGSQVRVAVALTFAANPTAAGFKGERLEPASCAWTGQPLGAGQPREVHFIAPAYLQVAPGPIDRSPDAAERHPDVASILAYLAQPTHYWSFNAYDTTAGYFDTTAHHVWKDFAAVPPATPAPLAPTTAHWVIRASTSGGIDGSSTQIQVDGDGGLQLTRTRRNVRCTAELDRAAVQAIETTIARSHPEHWAASYAPKDNPHGCCDQIGASLHLEQKDPSGGPRTVDTGWFTVSRVPEAITAVFDAVWAAGKVCGG
jgi:hypothetical protein